MNLGIGIAIGVAVLALIVVLVQRAMRGETRSQGLQLEPYVPARQISDEEFWALYWLKRVGVRRETKVVRAKSTNVILFGEIPISPNHSRWVYDLERSMLDKGLITQPTGKNWLATEDAKRALEARLGKEEKPLKPLQPLVSAETLQNVDLNSPKR
jgi:hypothetical protein